MLFYKNVCLIGVNAVHNVVSDEMCEEDEKGDQDASSKPVQKLQAETQILCMKSSTDVQNNFQKTKRLKK